MNIPKISALFETSLASAMTAAASSFTVVSGTDRDGNALSGRYGLIIDEGTADEEFVIGTISSTAVTIEYRGIDADAPNTEVSGNKKAHRRGASVKITDYPIVGVLRNILNGDESLPNKLAYASAPTFVYGNKELVTWDKAKDYADSLANTGAADANTTVQGLVEEATQAEVDARTATGGTGAKLFATPDKIRASQYHDYAADAGANDTYAITVTPAPTAYAAGQVFQFKANTANTGACTLNVNTLGAKSLKVHKDLDPQDGYIKAGQIVTVEYDGTNFQILSISGKPTVSQSGEEIYAASTTENDTYVITVAPVPAALATGMRFYFKPDTANTGAATLNVNGLGAKSVLRPDGSALANGDIAANQIVGVAYDGTNFLMITPVANAPKYANGVTTYATTTASGDQTIAHGLGRAPRYLRFVGTIGDGDAHNRSEGTWNGSTYATIVTGTNNASPIGSTSTAFIIQLYSRAVNGANHQTATVTVDATNITLTWTKTGSPTETGKIIWEAEA